jgi:hypothetical protein
VEEKLVAYDRSMSPSLVDITKLRYEERQINIVLEVDDRLELVRAYSSTTSARNYIMFCSSNIAGQSRHRGSLPRPLSLLHQRKKILWHQAAQIWHRRRSIAPKQREIWTKKKSCSTWRKILPIPRRTTGRTSIAHANHATSTGYTQDTNGTSIIRHTTSTCTTIIQDTQCQPVS